MINEQTNCKPWQYSTDAVAVGERMIMRLTEEERGLTNAIIDHYVKWLSNEELRGSSLIPQLLDGFMREIICGDDCRYLSSGIDQQDFTDECSLALQNDIHVDHEADGVYFYGAFNLERCFMSIIKDLLSYQLLRAAHNTLNVLIAFRRIENDIREKLNEQFKIEKI